MADTTKSSTTKGNQQRKAVYVIREGEDRSFWTRVGVAFVNQDGSLNVILNALPLDGKLHIRDFNGDRAEE